MSLPHRKVVPIFKLRSPSATFAEPSRMTLTPFQQRQAERYLDSSLPPGWERIFSPRRTGKNWGLSILCQQCGDKPPKEIRPWNRWRWLVAHMACRHT